MKQIRDFDKTDLICPVDYRCPVFAGRNSFNLFEYFGEILPILGKAQVTYHQLCWWFDVGPTGPILLFRLKAVRQTIAYYWKPLKSGSLLFSFHSVSLVLLGYILHDCFFVYFTDCFAIISSCPKMTVIFLPVLWMAIEYHKRTFTFYSSYSF